MKIFRTLEIYNSEFNSVRVTFENLSDNSLDNETQIILADGILVQTQAGNITEQIVDFVEPGGTLMIKSCSLASLLKTRSASFCISLEVQRSAV